MSYDVIVFDPGEAPRDFEAFQGWLEDLEEKFEGTDSEVPKSLSSNLLAFYDALRLKYPPMNGPNSSFDNDENERLTDYFFGEKTIDLGFRWSVASEAPVDVIKAAIDAGVGVFFHSNELEPAYSKKELAGLLE